MIETQIWLALKSRIDTLDLSSDLWPSWPVAWPGKDFTPVASKPFISLGRATSAPVRRIINSNVNDRNGYLTVSAVMPMGQETVIYEQIGAIISAHFQGCIVLGDTRLTLMSSAGQTAQVVDGYRDGAWWRVPVNIPWRTWR